MAYWHCSVLHPHVFRIVDNISDHTNTLAEADWDDCSMAPTITVKASESYSN
jgi:hypothetical protein